MAYRCNSTTPANKINRNSTTLQDLDGSWIRYVGNKFYSGVFINDSIYVAGLNIGMQKMYSITLPSGRKELGTLGFKRDAIGESFLESFVKSGNISKAMVTFIPRLLQMVDYMLLGKIR